MAGCREAGDTDCISPANLALSPGTLLPPPHSNIFSAKACIKPAIMAGCCHLALLSVQSQADAFTIRRGYCSRSQQRVTVAEVNRRANPQKYLQMQYNVVAMSQLNYAGCQLHIHIRNNAAHTHETIYISGMFSYSMGIPCV